MTEPTRSQARRLAAQRGVVIEQDIRWEQVYGGLPYKVRSREDGSMYVDLPIGRTELYAGDWVGYGADGEPVRFVRRATAGLIAEFV